MTSLSMSSTAKLNPDVEVAPDVPVLAAPALRVTVEERCKRIFDGAPTSGIASLDAAGFLRCGRSRR